MREENIAMPFFPKARKWILLIILVFGALGNSLSISAEETPTSYQSEANVEFEENTEITKPVDPDNPDPTKPVTPNPDPDVPGQEIEDGTQGPLSIDYASHFNFGKIKKSGNAAEYTAKPITITLSDGSSKDVAPYVQVTDNRGTNSGWNLQVRQLNQLTNNQEELKGAEITLTEGIINGTTNDTTGLTSQKVTLVPNGESQRLLIADQGSKGGTFTNSFGTEKGVGVELSIVAGSKINTGAYQADIEWTLEDTPE